MNDRLRINLDNNSYAVSNKKFKIICDKDFGFNAVGNDLSYFNGSSASAVLQVTTDDRLTLKINNWSIVKKEWQQIITRPSAKPLIYHIKLLKPNTAYT